MTNLGLRFCPRCGTARVADMSFCPGCGLNLTALGDRAAFGTGRQATPTDVANGTSIAAAGPSQSSWVGQLDGSRPSDGVSSTTIRPPVHQGFRVPPVVIVAPIVVVGLIVVGLLLRPQLGGSPASGGQATTGVAPSVSAAPSVPAALIVGLTILSPTNGQAVASKEVMVIGMAPPGLTITQDISFGLDQHATVDGTGHWAIKVGLNEGENKLTFRIGDDHSTQQTIRVVYTSPRTR